MLKKSGPLPPYCNLPTPPNAFLYLYCNDPIFFTQRYSHAGKAVAQHSAVLSVHVIKTVNTANVQWHVPQTIAFSPAQAESAEWNAEPRTVVSSGVHRSAESVHWLNVIVKKNHADRWALHFLYNSNLRVEDLLTRNRISITRGGGTPYNGLYGEAPPERGIFFRLQVYKRVGTLLVEVYERAGKSVMPVCERAQRANRWILWLLMSRKRSFTAFKMDAQF